MSNFNTVRITENRIQTYDTTLAARYQLRLGPTTFDSTSAFSSVQSTILFASQVGGNDYGLEFNAFNGSNAASLNYLTRIGSNLTSLNLITVNNVASAPAATMNASIMNAVNMSTAIMNTSSFTAANVSSITMNANLLTVPNISSINVSTSQLRAKDIVAATVSTTAMQTSSLTGAYYIETAFESVSTALISTFQTSAFYLSGNTPLAQLSNYDAISFEDSTGSNAIGFYISTGTNYINEKIAFSANNGSVISIPLEFISTATQTDMISYATVISSAKSAVLFNTTLNGNVINANQMSTAQIYGGTVNSAQVNALQFSTGVATIDQINARSISSAMISTAQLYAATTNGNVINVNQISSGRGIFDHLDVRSISSMIVSTGQQYVGVSFIKDLTCDMFTTTSDMRFKKNIVPLNGALSKIRALEPVYYDWIEHANMREGYPEVGFVAQAVNEVIPNIVAIKGEDSRMSVGYDRLTALLAGAIKELSERVEALERR